MAYRCMSRVKRRIFYLVACYQSNVSPPLSLPRVPFPTSTNNRSWSFPLSHTTSVFLQDKRNRGNSVDSKTVVTKVSWLLKRLYGLLRYRNLWQRKISTYRSTTNLTLSIYSVSSRELNIVYSLVIILL